jgi:hypothetical protein
MMVNYLVDFVNYLKLGCGFVAGYDPGMRFGPARKRRPTESARLILLQRQPERFTTARLDRAMQQAWNKDYDPKRFFSVAIPRDDGALLHAFGAEIAIRYGDYALDWSQLGHETLPYWAAHTSHAMLDYRCGKTPDPATRRQMYRGLAMLAAELASEQTVGFCFPFEQVLLPHSVEVLEAFRGRGPLDPFILQPLAE